ncbi:response regulator, partial [Clostridioides difficile]|nr:response regulator [Clostridioides difficile]
MPRMDGFTACRLLAADPLTCAIPVIFLTVAGALHERLEGFEIGCVDYVVKPFEPSEVLARIRGQLARERREQPVDTESPFA